MSATILPERLVSAALRSRLLDALLRHRATTIVARSGLAEALPREGLLVDLGAGLGHLAEAVLAHSPVRRCIGVDPHWAPPAPLAERLARRMPGRLGWIAAGGEALPLATGSVDGIWIAFVLHHLERPAQRRVLAEARRILRPGGTFVLLEDTPGDEVERRRTERADRRLNFEAAAVPHHYRGPEAWPQLLTAVGFGTCRQVGFHRIFPPVSLHAIRHTGYICTG